MNAISQHALLCIAVFYCILATSWGLPCFGEDHDFGLPANEIILLRNDAQRTVDELKRQFRPLLSSSQRGTFDSILVEIAPTQQMLAVGSFMKGGRRWISISTGWCWMMKQLIHAQVVADRLHRAEEMGKWLEYFCNDTLEESTRAKNGMPGKPYTSFVKYIGLPDDKLAALAQDDQALQAYGYATRVALAWILAHEYGHHILGHIDIPSAERAPSMEEEADAFAVDLLTRDDLQPVVALIPIGFTVFSIDTVISRPSPNSVNRFRKIVDRAFEQLRKQPQVQEYLKQNNLSNEIQRQYEQLLEILTREKDRRK